MSYEINGIVQYDQEELQSFLQEKDSKKIIIDVRETFEYNAGHIPTVPLIPLQQLPELIEQFDKEREYIFVCRSGNRSQQAAMFFRHHGLNAANYESGMIGWNGDIATGLEKVIQDVKELY